VAAAGAATAVGAIDISRCAHPIELKEASKRELAVLNDLGFSFARPGILGCSFKVAHNQHRDRLGRKG
jgi:hypothetical protein